MIDQKPGAESINRRPASAFNRWLFPLACLLCALPVMLPTYPPMVDIPQHAAQIATLKSMLAGSYPFSSLFQFKPFTPYWLGYALVLALSYPFGIVWAIKLVVAAYTCLLPLSVARFCSRFGVNPAWNWLFLALPFGFAYQWGFLNFLVAMPPAFAFLSSVLDSREKQDKRTWIITALWVCFLFFVHVLIAAFCCAVAAMMLLSPWKGIIPYIKRVSPLMAFLPMAALWAWQAIGGTQQSQDPLLWGVTPSRWLLFLPRMLGIPDKIELNLLGLLVIALPFAFGAKPSPSPSRWLPFFFYTAFTICFPTHFMGTYMIGERFGTFGLPLYLLCFEHPDIQRRNRDVAGMLAPITASIAVLMLGWQVFRASTYEFVSRGYSQVVEKAMPGKRMLMLMITPVAPPFEAPVFLHYASWYQAEKNGLTEFSFAQFYNLPLLFKDPASTSIGRDFDSRPYRFDWNLHHGERYDYFMIRSFFNPTPWFLKQSNCGVTILDHHDAWWLYRRSPDTSPCGQIN